MSSWKADFSRSLDLQIHALAIRGHFISTSWHLRDLITTVRANSSLLSHHNWSRGTVSDLPIILRALQRMAVSKFYWKRSIWQWAPDRSLSLRQQLASLSNHLFANYDLPPFLHNAWLSELDPVQIRDVQALFALGRGASMATLHLPIPFSKSVTKHFFTAADHYSVNEAMRWAQLRGEGASLEIAKLLMPLLPPIPFQNKQQFSENATELFWQDAIRFAIRQFNDLPPKQLYHQDLPELLEFARMLKLEPATRMLRFRGLRAQPLYPEFSFKGRTFRSLRRLVNNWREELAGRINELFEFKGPFREDRHGWLAMPIKPYLSDPDQEEANNRWTITELMNPNELKIEGAILRHCVGSHDYISDCKKRTVSIWSLRKWSERSSRRVVTIEIDNEDKSIVTALGKKNSEPSEEAWTIIRKWAKRESLKVFGDPPHLLN